MFQALKRDKGFYRYLAALTGPIALQNLITFSLGLIDTFMVSKLGNNEMAAVTAANVPVFLLISIVFGVQSGVGILISQYWGKKDLTNISRAIGVAAGLGVALALVVALVLFLWPIAIMDLLSNKHHLSLLGAPYLRLIGFSYVFNMLSSIYVSAQRSVENASFGMKLFGMSTVLNTGLNYLLIFGKCGFPMLGVEGAALAIAIIQDVRSKGALTAATTHYAELKTFAMTTAGVENASCEFDVQTLRPTYRLLIGIPGKSNAFAISRRLGLDESVIEAAKAQMDSESVRFEDVLTQLEEKRQRLEKAQTEADRLWQQREEDARKARTFREQMEKAKDNARTKGEAEARRIVRQAQQQAEQVFAELDELRKQQQRSDYQTVNDGKADVRRRLKEAEAALHQHDEEQEPIPAPSRPIAVGDTVELAGVRTAAAVLAVNGDGTLLLQAGKMKMTVKAAQVRLLETAEEIEEKKKQAAKSRAANGGGTVQINTGARASAELDIRGLETLEAESVVENYLDAAQRSKLGSVTIIHGKGTGALRAAVHQMLKKNRAVKSFRLGRYGEGEAGVTVVELK